MPYVAAISADLAVARIALLPPDPCGSEAYALSNTLLPQCAASDEGAGEPVAVSFGPEGFEVADAWLEIPQPRYREVWDRFDEAFEFRPSVRPQDWPTFREPSPSVTYAVADLLREFDTWRDAQATPYNLGLLRALVACVPEGESVLALDWQHRAYEFYPHRFRGADDPANWCIPALPSGEYHIFVTTDHRLGSLGHPWEGSVCVFGAGFVTEYSRHSLLGRDRIMRRRGAARLAEPGAPPESGGT